MRNRIATIGPIAAIAGWSLRSWVLIGLGLLLAAVGWARWARGRRDRSPSPPGPPTHVDAAPDQAADSTTGVTTKGNNL